MWLPKSIIISISCDVRTIYLIFEMSPTSSLVEVYHTVPIDAKFCWVLAALLYLYSVTRTQFSYKSMPSSTFAEHQFLLVYMTLLSLQILASCAFVGICSSWLFTSFSRLLAILINIAAKSKYNAEKLYNCTDHIWTIKKAKIPYIVLLCYLLLDILLCFPSLVHLFWFYLLLSTTKKKRALMSFLH